MAESLGTAVLDLTTDDSRLRSGLTRAETHSKRSFAAIGRSALVASGAIAVAYGSFRISKSIITSAGDFEQALNELWANAAHGKTTLAEVSKAAIKLGADAKLPAVSAADAANAMLLLAKSGFTVQQSMDAVRGTLLLATAAQTDAGTAAKVVTQNINAFGLHAKDTSRIVDNMAGFLRQTGTEFAAFADSLVYTAGPAHAAGQSFKETAAQLAILSKNGYEGSLAGTGLRQVLSRLEVPTGKAHDAFKKLGISTLDAHGKFIGIRSVIEQLQPKLDKMTQGDKAALWKEAFGQTAMNQARALLTTMPGQYDAMVASIGRTGQAQVLANSLTQGFNGALANLVNTLQSVGLTIGLALLPALTRFVRWMAVEVPVAVAATITAFKYLSSQYDQNRVAIQTAMGWIKTAVVGTFDFIKNTVIPQSIAAWAKYGPAIKQTLTTVVGDIRTIGRDIGAVISQIRQNWDTIWKLFGPGVTAAFQVIRTTVQTQLKIISGLFKVFHSVLHGEWGAAWGALKGIVTAILGGIVSTVGSILRGLAGTVKGLAEVAGKAIVSGIKTGLANIGDAVLGRLKQVVNEVNQVAQDVWAAALRIGQRIVSGVLSGLADLGSAVAKKVEGALSSAWNATGGKLHGSGDFMWTKHIAGIPMIQGVIDGIASMQGKLNSALAESITMAGAAGGRGVEGVTKKMTTVFEAWAASVKTRVAAAFDGMRLTIESKTAEAQAKLDVMKAKLTPSEALLASLQAKAALAQVEGAVAAAEKAIKDLKTKFDADWAQLLVDQKKNMDALKKVQGDLQTTSDIAGHEFDKTQKANANDPLATTLLQAQKSLTEVKAAYAAGTATQAELFAAQDAFDAASLAAADDTNAQKLLQDYTTWQDLLAQTVAGNQAIDNQNIADRDAQRALQDQYNADKGTAEDAYQAAGMARMEFYLGQKAELERKKADEAYVQYSGELTARHNRLITHIGNVEHAWDLHFTKLIKDAKTNGKSFADAYVNAIEDMATDTGPKSLQHALTEVAKLVQKYLKLNSPAEAGPLSTLDTWWTKMASTLIGGVRTQDISAFFGKVLDPQLSPTAMTRGAYGEAGARSIAAAAGGPAGQTNNFTFHETPANADPVAIGAVVSYMQKTLRT